MWQMPSALLFDGAEEKASHTAAWWHRSVGKNIEVSSENSSVLGQEGGLSDSVLLLCPSWCWGHCLCKDQGGQEPLPACWALSGQQRGCGEL